MQKARLHLGVPLGASLSLRPFVKDLTSSFFFLLEKGMSDGGHVSSIDSLTMHTLCSVCTEQL